jgi:hypothetical protein
MPHAPRPRRPSWLPAPRNAWGITLRPAGPGGHLRVTAGGSGNGASPGRIDALYLAAGPRDEEDGILGLAGPEPTGALLVGAGGLTGALARLRRQGAAR